MAWPRFWPSRDHAELTRLRESEARYRLLAEHGRDVIVQYDMAGVIQYASPSVSTVGWRPGDVIGRSILDFAHPDEVEGLRHNLAEVASGRTAPEGERPELRLRRADGAWIWVQGRPTPILGADGRPTAIVSVWRDITEQRLLEERLREGEARFRQLAEQSPDVIIRYDIDGRIDYLSPAVRAYGIEPADIVGRNFVDLLPPEDQERNARFFADLVAGRPLPQGELNVWRTPLRGGRWVDFEGATSPIVEDGRVVGAVATLRDVTARVALQQELRGKQTEAELALARLSESEARYRLLADHIGDVIFQYDLKGIVRYVSPSIAQFGYQPEEVVGQRVQPFIHPSDHDGVERFGRALTGGENLPSGPDNQFRFLKKNGEWIWREGNPKIVRDAEGKVLGAVTMARDITERQALEQELRRRQAEAEAAVVAKSEFLANMSHEIRTPLTAVVGFAGLLAKMADLPAKAHTYVDRIARSGEALTSIVNNVLDFSKIEAGQVVLKPEPFDLQALADEALGVVQDEAAAKGLTLTAEITGEAGAQILADAGRLRQVLLNLLTNAIKFTHRGGVSVALAHNAAARTLHVTVRDTGIGISPEFASRLFQRFSQVESSNARRFGGAGLGLAISRGLVELMGGAIGVESLEGEGSTFWFTMPAPAAGAAAAAPEPDYAQPTPGSRILVVDDARANRELIMALLSPFELQLTEAADGLEALEAARRNPFDLVLMDLQMPGMDGMAAARAIRGGALLNRGTPILAVSASVQPSDVEACRLAGMDDHIPKPINARELLGKVAHWTGGGGPQAVRAAR